jgi:hypothetical protein
MSELDAAWDAALDAPPADQRPWRVLADMLLGEGSPQGEWMQLELDAELGPVKGLARLRLAQLRKELPARLVPAGVDASEGTFRRAALLTVSCDALGLRAARDEDAWQSVRVLHARFDTLTEQPADVPRLPFTGARLRRVERLSTLPAAALDLVIDGPTRPRLSAVRVSLGARHPDAAWSSRWARLCGRQPTLRELALRDLPDSLAGAEAGFAALLAPFLSLKLERVSLEAAFPAVGRLWAWRRDTRPRFALTVSLWPRPLELDLTERGLVLRPAPSLDGSVAPQAGLEADARQVETWLRQTWWAAAGPFPPSGEAGEVPGAARRGCATLRTP